MEHIKKEIRLFLVCAHEDFNYERQIIHEYVVPHVRQHCMAKYNIEFSLVDPLHTTKGYSPPNLDRAFFMKTLKECQTLSDGPNCLILAGERLGGPKSPSTISEAHFTELLNQLKKSNNSSWMILQKVYSEDTSVVPTVYKKAQPGPSKDEEEALMSALQAAADLAKKAGKFKLEDMADYFKPDIETYVDWVLSDKKWSSNALCCIRNIQSFDALKDPQRAGYLDINSLGLIDTGKKKQIDGIKERLSKSMMRDSCLRFSVPPATMQAANGAACQTAKLKPANPTLAKILAKDQLQPGLASDDYLHAFATELIDRLKALISTAIQKKEYYSSPIFKDIETHLAMFEAIAEPKPLRNREREIKILDTYLTSTAQIPGLLYGEPGCGKSVLLRTIQKKVTTLYPRVKPVILVRQCGRTGSSSVLQLILSNMTQQLAQAFKVPITKSCEYASCVYDFWRVLQLATPNQPIIILLDNVESLFPQSHTEVFRWLPHKLPPSVKIVMTSSSETLFAGFKRRYDDSSAITVPGVDAAAMVTAFPRMVRGRGKQIDEKSLDASNTLIQENCAPLYVNLLADILPVVNPEKLPTRLKELFIKRIEMLETKFGSWLVKFCLSYLATSRFGLTLCELQDLLSLENVVVKATNFDFKGNTAFVFPTWYILLVLSDLKDYLSNIQIDDRIVISFCHEKLRGAIIDYYQLTKEFGRTIHQAHAEYWMSRYSIGHPKPLFDKSVESEERLSINIDRCNLSQQYFWCAEGRIGIFLCSCRRLTELPFHLLKADRIPDLFKYVIFCFEFLYSKLVVSSVNDVIAEMYFLRQAYDVKTNQELEILISLLRLLSISLDADAELLGPELAGRLTHVVGSQPLFTMLHQQLDYSSPKVNCLIPTIPCYPAIDADAIRVELSKTKKDIICAMSPDHRFITTLIPSDEDILLLVWDTKSATKSQIINIGLHPGIKFMQMFYMPQSDENVILQYETDDDIGIFFVNMDYASIENTLTFSKTMKPKILFLAKTYITIRVGGIHRVFEYPTGKESQFFKDLSWPFIITPSDKYCIAPKAKSKGETHGKPETDLRLINMSTRDTASNLTCSLNASYLVTTQRNDVLFVGTKSHGMVYRYEIGNVLKRDTKRMKASAELSLSSQNSLPNDLQELVKRYLPMIRVVSMEISIDDKSLLVEYNFNDIKTAHIVWQLSSKTVQTVLIKKPGDVVRFAHDSFYIYQFVPMKDTDTKLIVHSLVTANSVQEIDLRSKIQDVHIMKVGAIFSIFSREVVLTSLKQLEKQANKKSLDLQSYSVALTFPKYAPDLNIVFSNDSETSGFQYYNMDSNALFTVDMSHVNPSLTPFPIDRRLSPDGTKLMLAYLSEPNLEMKRERRQTIDEFVLKTDKIGHIIHDQIDFRKPEIPNINYFTGFKKDNPPKGPNRLTSDLVYEQKILRIFDLDDGILTAQLSISGERILALNNEYFFTIRPDYASITHNVPEATDVISLYDVTTGLYVNSVFLEHPVITAEFVNQNTKLMVSCGRQGKWLKLLQGAHFDEVEIVMDIETLMRNKDDYARTVNIRKLHVFAGACYTALLSYFWKDSEKEMYYVKVDLSKRDINSMFHAHDFIQDVSHDGTFAVDGALNVYDLNKGELLRRVIAPMINDGDIVHCAPQFTDDGAYIVVLDNDRNMLSVIRNDALASTVGRCQLHRMKNHENNLEPYTMTLGQGGRVVVVQNAAEYKIFVFKEVKPSVTKAGEPTYHNVMDRIRYLMPNKQKNAIDQEFDRLNVPIHRHSEKREDSNLDDKSKKLKKGTKKDGTALSRESTNVTKNVDPAPA